MMKELGEVLAEKNISLTVNDDALALIAEKSFSNKFGARNMRRFIQTNIEDKLAENIISDYNKTFTQAYVGEKDGELLITCM